MGVVCLFIAWVETWIRAITHCLNSLKEAPRLIKNSEQIQIALTAQYEDTRPVPTLFTYSHCSKCHNHRHVADNCHTYDPMTIYSRVTKNQKRKHSSHAMMAIHQPPRPPPFHVFYSYPGAVYSVPPLFLPL